MLEEFVSEVDHEFAGELLCPDFDLVVFGHSQQLKFVVLELVDGHAGDIGFVGFSDDGEDAFFGIENRNGPIISGNTDIRLIGHKNTCSGLANLFRWVQIFPNSDLIKTDNLVLVNKEKLMNLKFSSPLRK
jgi:hypothetical protein